MDDLKTFYLSIVDTSQGAGHRFVGVCIIKAAHVDNIIRVAKETGCLPHLSKSLEIEAADLTDLNLNINPDWLYRLMTKEEAEQEIFLTKS